jgi:hypothetical protein
VALERKRPEDKSELWRSPTGVRCYLDDIDDILTVLREIGEVRAETPDFHGTIVSAAELKAAGKQQLTELTLTSKAGHGHVTVRIGEAVGVVLSPRDDLVLVGAADRIRRALQRRQSKWRTLRSTNISPWLAVLGAFVALLLTSLSASQIAQALPQDSSAGSTVAIIVLVLGVFVAVTLGRAAVTYRASGVVVLAPRAEAPTWWERHRTEIAIGLATNAVVGVLFFVLGLWVGGS